MSRDKPQNIRWGIIGVGDVTELKSGPAYQKVEGFNIVSVMRRSADKVEDYAKRHNIPKFTTDADELIHDLEVDAIYIATPPDSHKEYALKVAKAGKPCCIEKPMAPSYADSLVIYEAFEQRELPLFIAYYRRSLPRFNQIKQWLDEKHIGIVRHVNCILTKGPSAIDLSESYNWRTDAKIAPGGYFDDLASHQLDLFAFLLGNFDKAHGISINQQGLYTAKDAVSSVWHHESGVTGSGVWNFGCDCDQDYVEILGSKGKIEFSIFDENPIRLTKGDEKLELIIPHPENVQLHHVEHMQKALTNVNYQHPSTGKNGLHTSWVMDKILGKF